MIIAKKFNENVLKLSYCEAGACEAGVGRVEPSHTIHTRGNDVSSKQELLSYFQKVSEIVYNTYYAREIDLNYFLETIFTRAVNIIL